MYKYFTEQVNLYHDQYKQHIPLTNLRHYQSIFKGVLSIGMLSFSSSDESKPAMLFKSDDNKIS
jgi:glutathionyl-hydroquinone reductase